MKTKIKLIFTLLLCAALLGSLSLTAFADGVNGPSEVSETVHVDGAQDRSIFAVGQTVDSTADVKGVLFAAGYNVNANGTGEYCMVAGYNTALSGDVEKDAFAAGYAVTQSGAVGRDAYIMGNDVYINGTVGRNLYVGGSRVILSGRIDGDVYVNAENITVSDGAEIKGTLRYNDDATLICGDPAVLGGTDTYSNAVEGYTQELPAEKSIGRIIWEKLRIYLGLAAAALVLLVLTPLWSVVDGKYTGEPFGKYARAFGIGFGVLAGVPLAAILLMVMQVGLRLAFVLLGLYLAAILVAPAFLGFFLGGLIWRRLIKKPACRWAELLIGILAWWILKLIPVLSFITGLVAVPLGLGVITLLLEKSGTAPTAPTPAVEEPATLALQDAPSYGDTGSSTYLQ